MSGHVLTVGVPFGFHLKSSAAPLHLHRSGGHVHPCGRRERRAHTHRRRRLAPRSGSPARRRGGGRWRERRLYLDAKRALDGYAPPTVPTFRVISAPEHLPPEGTRESPTLEFKGKLDTLPGGEKPDYFELAKDVASMAAVYGGTILVRAHGGSVLRQYEAMTSHEVERVCLAYENASKDRCLPVPMLLPEKVTYKDGFVAALNVLPVLDRPVAVKVKDAVADRFGPDAYVFPVRLSTHAVPYSPENLPMLLNPAIRRTIILLESIPESERADVSVNWSAPNVHAVGNFVLTQTAFTMLGVDVEGNALELRGAGKGATRVPLEDIEVVWKGDKHWAIRVVGEFKEGKYSTLRLR